jgi:hypothetical protein
MTLTEMQILTTFIVLMWFDVLGVHRMILKLVGRKPWDDFKPFTCFFCTHNWIGIIIAIIAITVQVRDWEGIFLVVEFLMLNFIVSIVLDRVLGHESIKGK